MTDATEHKPRPATPRNPLTEQMIEEMVAAYPELSRKKCVEVLIGPPAAKA